MRPPAAQRRRRQAALGAAVPALLAVLSLLAAAPVGAHWVSPAEIVAGLNQNPALKQATGVVEARRDPALPRLLLIRVDRRVWDTVPLEKRLALAQDWHDTWRHNVDEGIIAILDAKTDDSLVQFDAAGRARPGRAPAPPTPASADADPAGAGLEGAPTP